MEADQPSEFTGDEKPQGFLIVGIGASAGGVQALQEFFEHVPAGSGMAYVVILHLSPDHDSKLAQVLQAVSATPVLQVVEKTKIEPDNIYVVPPNQHLVITDGFIAPTPNIHVEDRRAPVDIFFRNLADTYGPRAVCVVLSGTGANGSMGLKRIKERGGVTYVQNPREAEFNEMPRNAIATELVDEVLPVAEIPEHIVKYRNSLGSIQIDIEPTLRPEEQQQALREIFTQLRLRTGNDFSNYKRATLLRRIERRINIRSLPDLPSYTAFLQEHPDEIHALLKDLLISVTNFFRDRKAFEALEHEVLPLIFDGRKGKEEVRIWVAGCATGEEAYSLAMLCAEHITGVLDPPKIQIFATDIDEAAITIAREGLYSLNDAADVSPDRLRRFFNKDGDGYRVRREIREMIIFAHHNFLKDPPFSRLDLITCRNVLIYLNSTAQERVAETFHFALRPQGFLFLGTSETVDGASDLYANFSRENHIYRTREISVRNYPIPDSVPAFHFAKNDPLQRPDETESRSQRISFGELHQKMLEQYAPPSVVVNEEYDIVHLSEKAGRYMEFTGGEPSQNLLKLIRPEMRLELRTALYQAVQNKTAVEARNVKLMLGGQVQSLDLQIRPVFTDGDAAKGFILILFKPNEDAQPDDRPVVMNADEPVTKRLEEELILLKAQLRSSTEQHEFQAEELKASNEELQAMNEELRSSAEELETSKEELQSINEELRTVNQELKVKVEETSLTSNNLQNLINSANVGTIFLDRSFSIRLFTPAVLDIFNLKSGDYGRPVTDITHRLQYDRLLSDAETVLEKLLPVEREVTTTDGRVFVMRLLPYRTAEDRINGVVITFFDITNIKESEKALQQSEEYLRLLIESATDYAILTLDMNRRVVRWSRGAESLIGYTEVEIQGRPGDIIFTPEDREMNFPEKEAGKAAKEGRAENERWHMRKDGSRFWGSGSVSLLRDNNGNGIGFVKIMRDLTAQKRSEDTLRWVAEFSAFRIALNDALRSAEKVEEIKATSCKLLGEHLNTDRVYYFEVGADGETNIVPAHCYTKSSRAQDFSQHPLKDFSAGALQNVFAGKTVTVADVHVIKEGTAAERQTYDRMAVRSFVAHPILKDGKAIAGLMVTDRVVREWTDNQIVLIEETAERTWAAVERAKAEEQLKTLNESLERLVAERTRALLDVNERLSLALEGAHAGCGWWNLKTGEAAWDERGKKLMGFVSDEESGSASAWLSRIHPDDRQRISDYSMECAREGKDFNMEYRVLYPNGDMRHFLGTGHFKKDADSQPSEGYGLVLDITERRKAEEEIQKNLTVLKQAEDLAQIGSWEYDVATKAFTWSEGMYRLFELPAGTAVEPEIYIQLAVTEDKDLAGTLVKNIRSGKPSPEETICLDINGIRKILKLKATSVTDERSNPVKVIGVDLDITIARESEEILQDQAHFIQSTNQALPDILFVMNIKEQNITYINRSMAAALGYTPAQTAGLKDSFFDTIFKDDLPAIMAHIEGMKSVKDGEVREIEYRRVDARGELRWYRDRNAVFKRNLQGVVVEKVGIAQDITEQKKSEQELKESNISLRYANENLQQFASVASHDLQEPLRKIKLFTSILKKNWNHIMPDEGKEVIHKINSSSDRMSQLIKEMLQYSKIAYGEKEFAPTDLDAILQNVMGDLDLLLEEAGATIDYPGPLPLIEAIPLQMHQLFYNILTNAAKYRKEAAPLLIGITTNAVAADTAKNHPYLKEDKDYIEIVFSDNGIGFNQQYAEQIFQIFERLHTAEEFAGTGVGLALCKKIAENHSGHIYAVSGEGAGASFHILLPVKQ